MNNFDKIVFSKTLENAAWNNTKLIKENLVEEVKKIKTNVGKKVLIFGSATFSSSLIKYGLIDEFRVMINPVILGNGIPLFKNIEKKIALQLIKTKVFGNGSVLLSYILHQ
jgi:dihydrofolate reductase